MPAPNVTGFLQPSQAVGLINQGNKPGVAADGNWQYQRYGKYGENVNHPATDENFLSEEGSYWKAVNATPGTAITANIQTTFSATKAFLTIQNSGPSGGPLLYLDYIRLITVTAPASATSTQIVLAMDSITRYSSGGTQITAFPTTSPFLAGPVPQITMYAGALTAAAAGSGVKYISRFCMFGAIEVTMSENVIAFRRPMGESNINGGTTAVRNVTSVGPCVLAPSGGAGYNTLVLHDYRPSNASTAPTYELEVGGYFR